MKKCILAIFLGCFCFSCASLWLPESTPDNETLFCENTEEIQLEEPSSETTVFSVEETPFYPVLPLTSSVRRLQLALAQLCVSESMFQTDTLDCRLIYQVMRYWSSDHHTLTMRAMRRYSRLTYDRSRPDSRRWIAFLNAEFREPLGWREDQTVPWSAVRQDFIEVYNYAGYLIRYPQTNPCTTQAHHWGARGFRRREHLRDGWILMNCGEPTMNDFWTMPNRVDPDVNVCYAGDRACSL